jgi:hypothetical protein
MIKKEPEDLVKELREVIEDRVEYLQDEITRIQEEINVWNQLMEYTIPFSYNKNFLTINSYLATSQHSSILRKYRTQISPRYDHPHDYDKKRIENKDLVTKICFNNSTSLKNAKIFWDVSKDLYWNTKPIIAYYCASQLSINRKTPFLQNGDLH